MNMKRIGSMLLCVLLAVAAAGCAEEAAVKNTVDGNMRTYHEMTDGTWMCEGRVYLYRLVIGGRMPNAAADSFFVYLSNIPEITFDRAYRAAGVSSSSEDYFSPEDAILVEMR